MLGAGSGAGTEGRQGPDTAQPGLRAGAAPVQSTDRASPGRGQAVGGHGSCSGGSGCLTAAPEGENSLESGGHLPVVTTPPVQEGCAVEHRVELSDNGSNKSNQVVVNLPALQIDFPPLHRSCRVKTQPDIYQAGQ